MAREREDDGGADRIGRTPGAHAEGVPGARGRGDSGSGGPAYGQGGDRTQEVLPRGAFFRIRFERVTRPVEFIEGYAGRSIAAVTDQSAASLYDFGFDRDDLLVFGSEGHGLPEAVIEACDACLTIPQRGATQSLNLGVASGIVLAEWFRQAERPTAAGTGTVHPAKGCGIPDVTKRYERRDVSHDY